MTAALRTIAVTDDASCRAALEEIARLKGAPHHSASAELARSLIRAVKAYGHVTESETRMPARHEIEAMNLEIALLKEIVLFLLHNAVTEDPYEAVRLMKIARAMGREEA